MPCGFQTIQEVFTLTTWPFRVSRIILCLITWPFLNSPIPPSLVAWMNHEGIEVTEAESSSVGQE